MLSVPADHVGQRLDIWLAQSPLGLSRSRAAALIRAGRILVNGQPIGRPSRALRREDQVTVSLPPPEPVTAQPEDLPLEIVYQDKWLVVVNKPAGIVVHPAAGNPRGTLVNALLHHVPDLSGIGGQRRPGIVHRLDKGTSGLLVVAKDDRTHRALVAQFKDRRVEKEYNAIVLGTPKPTTGLIDAPLARHPTQRKKIAVVQRGRPARTHYEVTRSWGHHSVLRLRLLTGRTHQIRVHLQFLGHPVAGDRVYGYRVPAMCRAALSSALAQRDGIFLHARRLALIHPQHGESMEWIVEPPPEFRVLARALDSLE